MHEVSTRRTFLILSVAAMACASATPLMAQSARRPQHAGGRAGGGGATADHASGHSSSDHAAGETDAPTDHDHTDTSHDSGGSHDERADSGKGKGPKFQGGAERSGSDHADGGHDDGEEHDHASGSTGGRRGPYYRGGRDVSGVTHGRGRSLEDRVLRANGDVHGG